MALTYIGTGGIFTVLGKYFHALNTLNTARETTIKTEVQDAVDTYKLATAADLDFDLAVRGLAQAEQAWRGSGAGLAASLATSCQGFLIQSIRADSDNNRLSLAQALTYLQEQMLADDYYIDPSVASVAVAVVSGGSGTDLTITATDVGRLGTQIDHIFPEVIEIEATTGGDAPVLTVIGERASGSKLSEDWPNGSGVAQSLSPLTVANSVITNGDFETWTIADTPDNWIIATGAPGTEFSMSVIAVQTVIISGTPTSGSYHLKYTDPATSLVHATEELAYNATGSAVQAALRALPGQRRNTVSTAGTSPDYTHTVTFTGVAGTVAEMTSVENTDTGAIAHADPVPGQFGAITGHGLYVPADESLVFYQAVSLDPDTVYAMGFWAGYDNWQEITNLGVQVALYDGIGGTVLTDDAGTDQEFIYLGKPAADKHFSHFFQIAKDSPDTVYLRLTINSSSDEEPMFDNFILAPATQIYPGGPYVAAFNGRTAPIVGDKWTLTGANDYAGGFQQKLNQVFPMAETGTMLRTAGSTNIPDSLIS